jgi:hypothetical protein
VTDRHHLVERLLTAADLWAAGVALRRQAIRRRHPHASDHEIDSMLSQWLLERPGAEKGDGPQPEAP